jgi:hypothetical protein
MGIEEKADIVKFARVSESEEDVRRETVGCVSTAVSSSVAVSASALVLSRQTVDNEGL